MIEHARDGGLQALWERCDQPLVRVALVWRAGCADETVDAALARARVVAESVGEMNDGEHLRAALDHADAWRRGKADRRALDDGYERLSEFFERHELGAKFPPERAPNPRDPLACALDTCCAALEFACLVDDLRGGASANVWSEWRAALDGYAAAESRLARFLGTHVRAPTLAQLMPTCAESGPRG